MKHTIWTYVTNINEIRLNINKALTANRTELVNKAECIINYIKNVELH